MPPGAGVCVLFGRVWTVLRAVGSDKLRRPKDLRQQSNKELPFCKIRSVLHHEESAAEGYVLIRVLDARSRGRRFPAC